MGTLNRLRYIQRNIVTTNVLTNTRLVTPTPRNMSTVQVSSGRQIAVLEAETHKECGGCRIRSCWYSQSAIPMLRVPIVAATTCNVKISSIKISSLIDGAPLAPGLGRKPPALRCRPWITCAFLACRLESAPADFAWRTPAGLGRAICGMRQAQVVCFIRCNFIETVAGGVQRLRLERGDTGKCCATSSMALSSRL